MIFSKNPLFRSLQSDLANAFHPTFQLKVQKRAGFMCLALARRDRALWRAAIARKHEKLPFAALHGERPR